MGCVSSIDVHKVYHLHKVRLGQGSFGVVWRAAHRATGEVVAVKELNKWRMREKELLKEQVEREISTMRGLEHENILRLAETFEDTKSVYMVLEYCDGGDFGDKILERGADMGEGEAAFWVQQMFAAIQYMHSKDVCHRDIKPDNFMVAGDDVLKVADLGLAMECRPGGAWLADKCGTPSFMAPELHLLPKSRGYGHPVDVWAAGVTAYMTLFQGKHPFLDAQGQLEGDRILAGEYDFPVAGLLDTLLNIRSLTPRSAEAQQFCLGLLSASPARRTSAGDALQSPWFGLASGGDVTTKTSVGSMIRMASRKLSLRSDDSEAVPKTPKRPQSMECALSCDSPLAGAGARADDPDEYEEQAPAVAARRQRARTATTRLKGITFDDGAVSAPLPRRKQRRASTESIVRVPSSRYRQGGGDIQAVRSQRSARARQASARALGVAVF